MEIFYYSCDINSSQNDHKIVVSASITIFFNNKTTKVIRILIFLFNLFRSESFFFFLSKFEVFCLEIILP